MMRSYRELAPLSRSLRGIFCDVDDTLTHAGSLVPAAYEALVRATDAGLRVVAVTGRPAGWAEVFACTWPLAGAIAENGAFAVRRSPKQGSTGKGVERSTWDPAASCAAQGEKLAAIADMIVRDIPGARVELVPDSGHVTNRDQPTIFNRIVLDFLAAH